MLHQLAAFGEREELRSAVKNPTLKQIRELPAGTRVTWTRMRAPRFGQWHGGNPQVYLELQDGPVAAELPGPEIAPDLVERHSCLIYGDCIRLAYVCDASYCDEVGMVATTTARQAAAPADPEQEWPDKPQRAMPVLEVIAVADRFGLYLREATRNP